MADYNRPDVYIEDVSSVASNSGSFSSTVGMLIGSHRSGPINEPTLVTSWTDFMQKFCLGLETPFVAESDLAYAVYGYFANGGNDLYVVRVASASAAKAQKTGAQDKNSNFTFKAFYEGDVTPKVEIVKNEDWDATNKLFDVVVTMNQVDGDYVAVRGVTKETILNDVNNTLKGYVTLEINGTVADLIEEEFSLTGGNSGITGLTDADYIAGLEYCNTVEDATFIAIPGETATNVRNKIIEYADNHELFPIVEAPVGTTVKNVKGIRREITAFGGCLVYPWIQIVDPLNDSIKTVPPSGYVMGVYSRVIGERGVKKVPAGVDAVMNGVVSLEMRLTDDDIGTLNNAGIVPIVNKIGVGLVVWGARSLSNDDDMRYVSDIIINYNIKKALYRNTLFAVFEPNDEILWNKVKSICDSYLEGLRNEGALKGTAEQAYRVICGETINTEATINDGFFYVDIAYAPNKPAEFVVIRIKHTMD